MNKKIIIGIVVVLLLALGAGVFLMNKSKEAGPATSNQISTATDKKSIKDLLGTSSNQECSFTDTTTGNKGSVYIASGKLRGDFTSKIGENLTGSHMIADGTNVYIWTDGQTQGFKVSQTSIEDLGADASKSFDLDAQVDYSCGAWAPNTGVFIPPTDITFNDYSNLLPSAVPGVAPQCAACASLTGDAKVQCETALKCN